MAIVRPFTGVRFNTQDISKLVCPPYDVISGTEKNALQKNSLHNIVRIELPDPAPSQNKYRHAGELFKQWRAKGILQKEKAPAFYLYEQAFKDKGSTKKRAGFFAALQLENPHKGAVKPHEKTLSGPKADRLKLLRSVKANVSPIFALFSDPEKKVIGLIKKTAKTKPAMRARGKDGVSHSLWLVQDPASIEVISRVLRPQDIFIADGHHRYETAWNYLQERKKEKRHARTFPYNFVMTFLCPMEDPGLVVWPTHRVFEPPRDFEERVEKYFKVLPRNAFYALSKKQPQPVLVYYKGAYRTLLVKNKSILHRFMAGQCAAYQELGVSILHYILLHDLKPEDFTYVKKESEALALAHKENRMAVMVPATPVAAVKKIALARQTMPQKSTYFYPKVITGMVMHSFA